MLATLAGVLALVLGLSLLLLPLLVQELSRPRDSVWGAVVLLLGLVLVTSADRLTGAPMLAVLCGGLLVGRLGTEVAQGRWRVLSDEERGALLSVERWSRSLNQLAAIGASLLQSAVLLSAGLAAWLAERRQGRSHGKRWVRSEATDPAGDGEQAAVATAQADAAPGAAESTPSGGAAGPSTSRQSPVAPATAVVAPQPAAPPPSPDQPPSSPEASPPPVDEPHAGASADPDVQVVSGFGEITPLLDAAGGQAPPAEAAAAEPADPPAASD